MKMDGIDTLNGKLISYARALKGIIPSTCEWLIIRDTDCVPLNRKQLQEMMIKRMWTHQMHQSLLFSKKDMGLNPRSWLIRTNLLA